MQYVSLVTGLAVAFIAALAMGGWQSADGASSRSAGFSGSSAYSAASSRPAAAATPAYDLPKGPPPSMLVFVVDTREEAEDAERRFGPSYPGWERAVLIIDNPVAAREFVYALESLLEAERLGSVSALKILDLRGP
ncbi:MAG TPA: hypothetical protein VI759_10730 [Dehalococcoidia bacterium]|nr:hypothetical protein [Dehalococcoidia bacterium]